LNSSVRQGELFWVDLGDHGGSEPGYNHPCVIIQNDIFNQSKIDTVVVCLITSNLRLAKAPGNVYLQKGEGNLPKDSVVNISQIVTIDRSFLRDKIGTLSRLTTEKIIDGVKLLIEPREPLEG
jgi:mRNA interferase MazF